MKSQHALDTPDLMSAIVEETRRRNQEQSRRNSLFTNDSANDRAPQPPRGAFASHIIFALLFSIVLALSVVVGAVLGLGTVALVLAFFLAPISAPFFVVGALIGAATLYLLLHGQHLARQAERHARIKKEVRIARARHA